MMLSKQSKLISPAIVFVLKRRAQELKRREEVVSFKLTPKKLLKAITPKTKLLILNSPNNPTGAVYSKEELEGLAKVVLKKKLFIISDQSHITPNPCSFAQKGVVEAILGDQTIVEKMIQSFSKRRKLMLKLLATIKNVEIISQRRNQKIKKVSEQVHKALLEIFLAGCHHSML